MISSINYHKIFDYPLVKSDYPKWLYKNEKTPLRINATKGQVRIKREKISKQKLKIAQKASKILEIIPTVKFVGITGSLAMMNANRNSDIDLMIITKKSTLWMTRLVCLIIFFNKIRRAKNNDEKDKLCFNLWLDESDIEWDKKDRNIYTAHEIAQVVPLVNKDKTYEKFLWLNRWISEYWPLAVKILRYKDIKLKEKNKTNYFVSIYSISLLVEKLAFKIQYLYMKEKITREIITPTRAIFHPNDWGKMVITKLKS